MNVYCPYSDKEVPASRTSPEHVIPLSLGGDNRLTLRVDAEVNTRLGGSIDGPLANEFLLTGRRAEYDARGHSAQEPEFVVKRARDSDTGQPLQARWGRQLRLWDPRRGEEIPLQGQRIEGSFKSNILDLSLRFVAKTFLPAGYLAYGDLFRHGVAHHNARLAMRAPRDLTPTEVASMQARVFIGLTPPSEGEGKDEREFKLQSAICSAISGSVVVLAPGPRSFAAYVGVLGMYLGMINVPADTSRFPRKGAYEAGHALIVSNGNVLRCSYRRLIERISRASETRPGPGGA